MTGGQSGCSGLSGSENHADTLRFPPDCAGAGRPALWINFIELGLAKELLRCYDQLMGCCIPI
ncbi:hypothetical protein B5E82_06795 [Lachnoclostridium sp. An138]|nr:hypothetical protein B5E82_06795 [Lachnoclostridium sp. An138]